MQQSEVHPRRWEFKEAGATSFHFVDCALHGEPVATYELSNDVLVDVDEEHRVVVIIVRSAHVEPLLLEGTVNRLRKVDGLSG